MHVLNVPPAALLRAIERTKSSAWHIELERSADGPAATIEDPRAAQIGLIAVASAGCVALLNPTPETAAFLRGLWERDDQEVVLHNALVGLLALQQHRLLTVATIRCRLRDVKVASHLLNENESPELHEIARSVLRRRLLSRAEAIEQSLEATLIALNEKEIDEYADRCRRFERVRPWPRFDSHEQLKRSDVAKQLREAREAAFPGTPGRTAKGEPKRTFTPAERDGRKQAETEGLRQIEHIFGWGEQFAYEQWTERKLLAPRRAENVRLRQKLRERLRERARDAAIAVQRLWTRLKKEAERHQLTQWLLLECEIRRITVVMSATGLPIAQPVLQELKERLEPLVTKFRGQIFDIVKNDQFNPDSPAQLVRMLFVTLGCTIPVFRELPDGRRLPKLTPGGELLVERRNLDIDLRFPHRITDQTRVQCLACDGEVLERVAHPLGQAILNFRAAHKLLSTYVEPLLARAAADPHSRVAGNFDSTVTLTLRLSSDSPNLQNIPSRKRAEFYDKDVQNVGPELRRAFIPTPGYDLIIADQSQIELRIIAHFCRDRELLEVYKEGITIDGVTHYTGDIHSRTAKSLAIKRKDAKPINFGFNYGMGPLKFARQTRLFLEGTKEYDIPKAAAWRTGFFQTYASIPEFIERAEKAWKNEQHDFKMLSGRERHFLVDDRPTGGKILNAKVQGSSADIIKINMYLIDRYVRPVCPSLECLFQVHDELGYQTLPCDTRLAAILIKYVMEWPWFPLAVPILAGAKICRSWDAKDDDAVPEVGLYYARIKDLGDRVFSPATWPEYLQYDREKRVELKGACAMLSPEDRLEAARYIPATLPLIA